MPCGVCFFFFSSLEGSRSSARVGPRPASGSGRERHLGPYVNTLRLAHLLLPDGPVEYRERYSLTRLQGRDEETPRAASWRAAFAPPDRPDMYPPHAFFWPDVWALRPPSVAWREATSGRPLGMGAEDERADLRRWVEWSCDPRTGILPVPGAP